MRFAVVAQQACAAMARKIQILEYTMRLGGRASAAIEILDALDAQPKPATHGLREWAQSHRFAGSGDRAAIGTLIFDALRNKSANQYIFGAETSRAMVLGALIRQWQRTPEELNEAFDGDTHAPELLSEEELSNLKTNLSSPVPNDVTANVPKWIRSHFEGVFGDDWIAQAQAFCERPPLDIRGNLQKVNHDKLLTHIARHGAKKSDIAPHGLRILPPEADGRLPNITAEPVFARGLFEIQDSGSQIAAHLSGAKPGEQILDFCAGAGGKALAMSAMMANKGQIHAYDIDSRRLSPLVDRAKRNMARNIQLCDSPEKLELLTGKMDRVVVDAPCTGTGTWRRRPDIKWRLTFENLDERMKQQKEALDTASHFVKENGVLIYITCSVLPSENAEQIDAFLQNHRQFKALDIKAHWENLLDVPFEDHALISGDGLMLTPKTSGTDGFFLAVLQRQS